MPKSAQDQWSEDIEEMDVPRMVHIARTFLGYELGTMLVHCGGALQACGGFVRVNHPKCRDIQVLSQPWHSDTFAMRHALTEAADKACKLHASRANVWLGSEMPENQ